MTYELIGEVELEPPPLPEVVMDPPSGGELVVVPIAGPTGPQGPVGPPGDPGAALAYKYTTSTPAMLHQIAHGLQFEPAGITCKDADGSMLFGWSVTHPAPGITEITFGAPVTPVIYLS